MLNAAWNWCPIGELFEIGAGKTMSSSAREGSKKIPFLRTSNVYWDEINLETVDAMSIPDRELPMKLLQSGDLLVCEGGEIGRSAIWEGQVSIMAFQNHLHRLRPLTDEIVPRFYVYFLQSAFTQLGIFEGAGNKTTIPNLSRNRLLALEVPKPTRAEQIAVVNTLLAVRRAFQRHEQAANLTADLKLAAMRELFTRGLRGEPQKQTEIGPMPERWEVVPFNGALHIAQGQVDPKVEPYASMRHIGPENIEPHSGHLLPCQIASELGLISGKYQFSAGDIVYSKIRPYLNKVAMPPFAGLCSADMYPLRPTKDFNSRFLFHYILSEFFLKQAVPHQLRTGIPKVNREQLSTTSFPKPSSAEQTEISRILDAIDRKLDLHKQKRAVLEELFKTLLHKVMTGEIRVEELDLSALDSRITTSPL